MTRELVAGGSEHCSGRTPAVLAFLSVLLTSSCSGLGTAPQPKPAEPVADPPPAQNSAPPPVASADPQLQQQVSRLELRLLEKEAQVDELQTRLDDARREVVRAMAKLQSLATRAEAASGMAEAEIALQSLRASGSTRGVAEVSQLMQLSTAEFNKQNYGGALYLANQAKAGAFAARGQLASTERGALRAGEVPFALPLQLQTTGRANVRDGPGGAFTIMFTLAAGTALTGYSYAEQWVRVSDDSGRRGWVHQGLIRRPP